MTPSLRAVAPLTLAGLLATVAVAQPPFGPGGPGGPPFGPGGMMGQDRPVVKDFDTDGDGRLNSNERKAAREALTQGGNRRRGPGGFGPFGRGDREPPKPGKAVSPADVKAYPDVPLYEPTVLRTVLLQFENADWEAELEDFHNTDVEVPATLTADGKQYPHVGVHFRGMSSYGGVPRGYKRSLNVAVDFADPKQRLHGYKTLNLLNAHEDPSFLSSVLYSHVARQYVPAPKANLVRVVINGESWGVYASVQQFDKVFLEENYKTDKGTRWKVRGSPGGGGGLEYLGDDVAAYKRRYEVKGGESDKAWKAFANLCKVLNTTPAEELPKALEPILDVDALLWFLALDVALVNNDGYWVRASDYSLYLDPKGTFHVVPHDMNEAFRPAGGPGFGGVMMAIPRPGEVLPRPLHDVLGLTPGQRKQLDALQKDVDDRLREILTPEQNKQVQEMRERRPFAIAGGPPPGGPGGFGPPPGGPPDGPPSRGPGGPGGPGGFGPPGGGGGGIELDPLVGLTDRTKPLRSKVLAVPMWREQYLRNVRTIAEKSLDWKALGPVVAQFRTLIADEVEADTRKLESFEAFTRATADEPSAAGGAGERRGRGMPLRAFADQRRKYLLDHPEIKKLTP